MSDLTKQSDVSVSQTESSLSILLKQKVITIKQAASVCYVLNDKSGSMRGMKWDELIKANIILGQHSVGTDLVTCIFASDFKADICLEDESVGGGTNMTGALKELYKIIKGKQYKSTRVILVSDGRPDSVPSSVIDVVKMLYEGIIIDTVGIGEDCDKELLKNIAKLTGGTFEFCQDGKFEGLSQILLELSPEMRQIEHTVIKL